MTTSPADPGDRLPSGEIQDLPEVLACVAPELEQAVRFMDGESQGHFSDLWEQRTIIRTRSVERTLERKGIAKTYFKVIGSLAMLTLERPEEDPESQEAFVRSFFEPLESIGGLPAVKELPLQVLTHMEMLQTLDALSSTVSSRLHDEIGDDTGRQFQLAQLLATNHFDVKTSKDPHSKTVRALQILATFEALRHEEGGMIASAVEGLESGKFDSHLAETMLTEARQDPQATPSEAGEFLAFSLWLAGDEAPTVLGKLATAEGLGYWPGPYRRMLGSYRSRQLQELKHNHAENTRYLAEHDCVPTRTTEEAINQLIDQLAAGMFKRVAGDSSHTTLTRTRAKISSLQQDPRVARQRRRLTRQSGRKQSRPAVQEEVSDSPEAPKLRGITYINSQGEEWPEGSKEYKDFIADYVDKHAGDQGFGNDVRTILEAVRGVDLSKGRVNGIGQLKQGTDKGLYLMEVGKFSNLQLTSANARKTRVVFALLDKGTKIGLRALLDDYNELARYTRH